MNSSKNYSDSDAGPLRSLETKGKQKANDEGLAAPSILVPSKPSLPTSSMIWRQAPRMHHVYHLLHLRRKLPAPSKRILDHLRSLHRKNVQVSVVIIDELMTSQVCAECHQRNLIHVKDRSVPYNRRGANIHAVLKCSSCSMMWNRDVMAAKDILYIFEYMALNSNKWPDLISANHQRTPGKTLAVEDLAVGWVVRVEEEADS
ncbi:hypothetical protein INT43_003488 [Umbelopsis isabellina]|uniref:Cas12f1-like TNB domain-containing protein n=1 Tax=Mortierella isabellina TaxID=91625 RepID=A0A8H7UCU1_MORIS|nr:hypothetical protein INT43_003488 [Umbelopsis isabellina]